ncbi:MAG: hypothetical protein ACI9BD_000895 [Candidatus Marinamargulisbacteria bacterium]|jgi:hypothetical protein
MNKNLLFLLTLIVTAQMSWALMPSGIMPSGKDKEPFLPYEAQSLSLRKTAPVKQTRKSVLTISKRRNMVMGFNKSLPEAILSQGKTTQAVTPEVTGKLLNFPNPTKFNSEGTTIGYHLSTDMDIRLDVYDSAGNRLFFKLFTSGQNGGLGTVYNEYFFSTADLNGLALSTGIYFYTLSNNGNVLAKSKMALTQ